MKSEKGSTQTIILVVIIVILVAVVAYLYAMNKKGTTSPVESASPSVSASSSPVSDTATYSDSQLSFDYPKILTVSKQTDSVVLIHQIPHVQHVPCDFKGDAGQVTSIVDFNASFRVVNMGIQDYVKSTNADWTFISKNPFSLGVWKGYKADTGVEGCGVITYYLTITPTKTLVARRPYSDDLSPISADYQKNLSIPGIIKPEVADQYFNQILASLKVK